MPLDWLNQPLDTAVSDLIARKKRAKAIELLRIQLQGRMAPAVTTRLQLCDLLVQAGREQEAVPILIGLADEFANDGFVAKAIAILKRVEKIDPGPHVDERLQKLVKQQRQTLAQPARSGPAFDVEEVVDEPMPAETTEPEAFVEPMVEPLPEEPPIVPTPIGAAAAENPEYEAARAAELQPPDEEETFVEAEPLAAEPEPEPEPEAEPVVAQPEDTRTVEFGVPPAASEPPVVMADLDSAARTVEFTAPEGDRPPSAPTPGVAKRIRGAFKRFLASLGAEREDAPAPEAEPAAPVAEEPAPLVEAAAEPAPPEAPGPEAVPEPAPAPELVATPVAELPAEATPGDPEDMPQAEFQEALLDIVSEVVRRPRSVPLEGAQLAEYAQRLLATELFGSLTEEELLAVVHGLRLHVWDPGDVLVTEQEPGRSLFVITEGEVRVHVRNPSGRAFEVARLRAGEFFGEMSILSGRPRAATIVAATVVEALELDRSALDAIAATHPRVADVLERAYIARASHPEAAAVRAVPLEAGDKSKAMEALEAHFGESRWDPRMRLRLADLLARVGKDQDAIPILVGLADDLAREGFPEKAVAILKKIEQLQKRSQEFVSLAPLPARREAPKPEKPARPAPLPEDPQPAWRGRTDERFNTWLLDVVRDTVKRTPAPEAPVPTALRGYTPGLIASPLFEDFEEDELLALIQGLRLLTYEPGEIVVTEGEPGASIFILSSGTVKVFVRDHAGRSGFVCALVDGAFFGEMSALSGRPRSATVTAGTRCELLELDRATLDRISGEHPRVRELLAEFSAHRAADPAAQALREPTA